ncbi:serine/threonine-protein phosphatase [Streptomyces sp. RLB3-17]|uniref:PP2C family protein-serine/threonine phosphatase n=1 Tax=unclassified Streptomyces TaxID=2593676 RepID=UPI0011632004|nr:MULTISPECIES: PP2C family protein-serine/threonine phosphatase [unclassified Streptomyces]NMI54346.1 serine/threonine-protein phosphatase [Streptomyces sp. RLA2-12]QDN64243.1 serine/threonine-protein phosphatase [Streptomyces sp. S1D4-20]QDN74286.1 serine/threonine-protein phosphatase [Streptomyces sp. S1D4-14]QDO04990.1 serine/threonine-protein phosphatase [Streptomyces sp. RLB1-9]QDO26780.1 serine/threonine-protein phosphatase [Streptomyces sp. S1A1-8]
MGEESVDRSEGFGERLLGLLLDRARLMPPQLIAPLIAEEVAGIGGRDVSILLQDYAQEVLVPLAGSKLHVGQPEPMADSPAGRAFLSADVVEVPQAHGGVRMYLPLLDGSDQVGVMALTLDAVGDADRRLLRRLAGLVADMLVTKNAYTDLFFLARRREPMSVSAEIQWSLLPPLTMTLPQVAVAGILEPAYRVAGDSFDYALNGNILHMAVIDAMGHGLDAAAMATIAIGAYRHARRVFVSLAEKYAFMDDAISRQFGPDHFVTAQLMHINIATGELEMVNAGHPAPLLIREGRVERQLESATTLPVGFGGEEPRIREHLLQPGDRVLCYTDGIIEEHVTGGEPFGEERLIHCVNRLGEEPSQGVRADLRRLSHTLKRERGGHTSDDATLFMIEWHGGAADHLAVR